MDTLTIIVIDNMKERNMATSSRGEGLRAAIASFNGARGEGRPDFVLEFVKAAEMGERAVLDKLEAANAYILSGSKYSLTRFEEKPRLQRVFKKEIELVRDTTRPVLGICFGHQLLGLAHEAPVVRCPAKEAGLMDLEIDERFKLVRGTPKVMKVEQHHEKMVDLDSVVDAGFTVHASTVHCPVQAMQHERAEHYGVQFHPETRLQGAVEDGRALLVAFLERVASLRRG